MKRIASLFAPVALSAAMAPVKVERYILEPVHRFENKRMCLPLADLVVSFQAPLTMLCAKLSLLATLQDGWAGEGSVPPSKEAIAMATDFLAALEPRYVAHLNIDDVVPSPYGTISLEWMNKGREYVCVEVGDDEIGYFYNLHGEESTSEDKPLSPGESIVNHVGYLLEDLYEAANVATEYTA
ncbi:hypothetical protein GCM10027594_11020 [Hymenobacter agri]